MKKFYLTLLGFFLTFSAGIAHSETNTADFQSSNASQKFIDGSWVSNYGDIWTFQTDPQFHLYGKLSISVEGSGTREFYFYIQQDPTDSSMWQLFLNNAPNAHLDFSKNVGPNSFQAIAYEQDGRSLPYTFTRR